MFLRFENVFYKIYLELVLGSIRSKVFIFSLVILIRLSIGLTESSCSGRAEGQMGLIIASLTSTVAVVGASIACSNRTYNQTERHHRSRGSNEDDVNRQLALCKKDLQEQKEINVRHSENSVQQNYRILELEKNVSNNGNKIVELETSLAEVRQYAITNCILNRDLTRVGSDVDILRVSSGFNLDRLGERTKIPELQNPHYGKLVSTVEAVIW